MEIKDKILLTIAMDDYESNKPGFRYSLDSFEDGTVNVIFYDEGYDIIHIQFSKVDPYNCSNIGCHNDPKEFFKAVRKIVYEV